MIWSKRPGTVIPAYRMDEVVGQYATRDIPENTLISEADISETKNY